MSGPSEPTPYSSRLCDLILEQLRDTVWSLADEVKDVGPGWVSRAPSLPDVWAVNQLHITRAASPAEVMALAEQHQGDLSFRHLRVEPEATARELETALHGAGWKIDREVFMALMGRPNREVPTDAVVPLSDEQMATLMRRWLREDFPDVETERLDQVDDYTRREGKLWAERGFGILDDAGAPAAITKLRSRRGIGWVEDVYTVPEQRNRGFARALVTHATTLARSGGHELTFIIADDNDWPKHLYESIGFRRVGTAWTFHRAGPLPDSTA
jgi:GNAT superfamily N-acetyltransferase